MTTRSCVEETPETVSGMSPIPPDCSGAGLPDGVLIPCLSLFSSFEAVVDDDNYEEKFLGRLPGHLGQLIIP